MTQEIDTNTPLVMLTVGQFNKLCGNPQTKVIDTMNTAKNYVYGIPGIEKLFNCSKSTANRIKKSGKIDKAISQVGRKICIDRDYALELAGEKKGGLK